MAIARVDRTERVAGEDMLGSADRSIHDAGATDRGRAAVLEAQPANTGLGWQIGGTRD
jgi:hypothetical protein